MATSVVITTSAMTAAVMTVAAAQLAADRDVERRADLLPPPLNKTDHGGDQQL